MILGGSMTIGKFGSFVLLSLSLTAPAFAKAPRPPVEPAKAGLDAAKLATLRAALQKFVDDKKIAGAVTVIGRKGYLASVEVVGARDVEEKKPMELDTVFRIASMSKISTSVGIMILEDDGKLSVDDPIEKHLPEFRGQRLIVKDDGKGTYTLAAPERPVTIKDLMTHTSGF